MKVQLSDNMSKPDFIAYLRQRGMTFDEFYTLSNAYFNLDSNDRFDMIKKTKLYKNFKRQ